MSRSPIRFYIQRKAPNHHDDDVIEIQKIRGHRYVLTYVDHHSDFQSRVTLDEISTLRYIQTMMDMLWVDSDPFEFIQIDIPCYPSIQLEIDRLDSPTIRKNLFTQIKMCMRDWPETLNSEYIRENRITSRPPGSI